MFEKSQVEAVKEMNERHQEVHVFPFCILYYLIYFQETDQMKGSESEAAALT